MALPPKKKPEKKRLPNKVTFSKEKVVKIEEPEVKKSLNKVTFKEEVIQAKDIDEAIRKKRNRKKTK